VETGTYEHQYTVTNHHDKIKLLHNLATQRDDDNDKYVHTI